MNIGEKELQILEFWKNNKTFEKSLEGKDKNYVFYDGPPFATGLPHYGHLLASTIKDTIPRYWTMKGYKVDRIWGWDCHGLPIEAIAEKQLKLKSKKDIEEMGVDKFCNFCGDMVLKYASEWKKTIERLGRWVEFDNAYKTMDNSYMESVWWAFKQIWEKGLIYEGRRVLMYCPRCETPLANAEIAMDNSYKDVTEDSVIAKFKLKDKGEYFLAWTTTPWTLVGNVALAVNPKADYVKVENKGKHYILAMERVSELVGEHKILSYFKGVDLEGLEYEPLYGVDIDAKKKGHYVISGGEEVTTTDGTGIVHMAAYGEFDYEMIKKHDLPVVDHIGNDGKLREGPEKWKGKWFKDLDKDVIEDLEERDLLYVARKYTHSYPFCYRCATPLFYAPLPSWFVNIQKVKDNILKNNEGMNWYPDHLKHGRFKNNVEKAPDWNISRNRYWASVIPVWKCECGECKVIGSIEELRREGIDVPEELDLHKHVVDKIKLKCDCGKEMNRVPEVLDCWFESGSMPFAQMHYPFENKEKFEENFPGDFVAEYIAQTRTWFYYSLAVSTMLFDKPPFKNVSTTGTILAENGDKMSKSLGNFPDPQIIIDKYGADALRFYLLSSSVMDAEDANFSEKSVDEVYKKVLLLLYNVNKFYEINSEGELSESKSDNVLDLWISSRLNELKLEVTKNLDNYNTVRACRAVVSFVDDLSTWYVRRSRDRFNGENAGVARNCLRNVLIETVKVLAPLLPFASDSIYQKVIGEGKSVHLEEWPKVDEKKIDLELHEEMSKTRQIVSMAMRERDRAGVGVRQALAELEVKGMQVEENFVEIVKEEVNVRNVKFVDGEEVAVKLDLELTPELEAEGFSREIARRVQAERKKKGLQKSDSIELELYVESDLQERLKEYLEFIKERTGSKNLDFVDDKNDKMIEFEVKGKDFAISF